VEIRTGDGTVRRFGPGSVLLAEDLTGQGHTHPGLGHGDPLHYSRATSRLSSAGPIVKQPPCPNSVPPVSRGKIPSPSGRRLG
jgi:hypothetical protein